MLENTVVVITSDHGEAFGEHGACGHSYSVNMEEVGVPLLVLAPKAPPGRIVYNPVSLRDSFRDGDRPARLFTELTLSRPIVGRLVGGSRRQGTDRPDQPRVLRKGLRRDRCGRAGQGPQDIADTKCRLSLSAASSTSATPKAMSSSTTSGTTPRRNATYCRSCGQSADFFGGSGRCCWTPSSKIPAPHRRKSLPENLPRRALGASCLPNPGLRPPPKSPLCPQARSLAWYGTCGNSAGRDSGISFECTPTRP